MPEIGLCGPDYTSQSPNADCQSTTNWYPELVESKSPKVVLYPTPGKRLAYDLGAIGPDRGLYPLNGRLYTVSGSVFWELMADGSKTNRTSGLTIVSDGGPVSFAGGPSQVLLASANHAYVFDTDANTFIALDGTIDNVIRVGYLNGFFTALHRDVNGKVKWRTSDLLDATSWPGDNATLVSVFTDDPTAIFIDHGEPWIFGPRAIQPYALTGAVPFPFEVREGTLIESGLAAPFSIAKLDNSLFWLGADERGQGVVRRANGYSAVRVSTFAIEQEIQGYASISDAVGFGYQFKGHEFYRLSFPTAEKTWEYDASNGLWHRCGFWNTQAGVFTRDRAQYHAFIFGKHLVGDPTSATVYEMSGNVLDDFGNSIRRVRRVSPISKDQEWLMHQSMQVYLETGLATFDNPLGATNFVLKSANGQLWALTMSDLGVPQTLAVDSGDEDTIFLNSPTDTSFQLTVSNLGVLRPVAVGAGGYDNTVPFVSQNGLLLWNLQISDVGSGVGIIQTFPQGKSQRGPLLSMRFSDDSGHTWSNERFVDCGKLGKYDARAVFRRLGRARNRVYEIAVTDPVPWNIIDGILIAA